jgi:Lon protease-like protein
MTSPFDLSAELCDFSGFAPLFPLPNVVLFPHVLQPLHIFEPRYRQMVADALEDERLLAMALLQPGWETATDPNPAIYPMVCLGRITAEERLESGRYNLILQGLQRAVVTEEIETDMPYRTARLKLQRDLYVPGVEEYEPGLRGELLAGFREMFPQLAVEQDLQHIFETEIPLGILCDVVAYALRLPPDKAQELLAELSVEQRCELLVKRIRELAAASGSKAHPTFPPKFSAN